MPLPAVVRSPLALAEMWRFLLSVAVALVGRTGVEAVRVELQGAVYYLVVIIDRSPCEPLRPSETVEILLP